MRKITSLFFAILLLFSIFPFATYANNINADIFSNSQYEDYTLSKDQLVSLAIEVFPEYKSKILSDSVSQASTYALIKEENNYIVNQETRNIGDDIVATLVEWYDGLVELIFQCSRTLESSNSGTGYMLHVMDVWVMGNIFSGVMHINDFTYCNVQGPNDHIASLGSLHGYDINAYIAEHKLREDASGPAYAEYNGIFMAVYPGIYGDIFVNMPVTLRIEVGSDGCKYILT